MLVDFITKPSFISDNEKQPYEETNKNSIGKVVIMIFSLNSLNSTPYCKKGNAILEARLK